MKILLVGSSKSWAIEASYKKHLAKSAEVEMFNARDLFLAYYNKSIFHKIIHRLGLSSQLDRINSELYNVVTKTQPDIVWVFKGMEIYPETLKKIKLLGIKLANYNADDPFDFTFNGSGNINVKNSLALYDLHFSYSKRIVTKFQTELKIDSIWLPFAYTKTLHPQNSIKYPDIVCFIGNPDKERAELLKFLATNGMKLHIYGSNWNKFIEHSNALVHNSVLNEDFITTAQKYYCQVNIFRPQNVDSHNMRTFEMPAIGCIMFAPRSKEHLELFEENKEAFYYNTKDELLRQLQNVLKLNENTKQSIAKNAFLRSTKEKYSYENRAETVLSAFRDII